MKYNNNMNDIGKKIDMIITLKYKIMYTFC